MDALYTSNSIFFWSFVIASFVTLAWVPAARYFCKKTVQECDSPFHLIQPAKLAKGKNLLNGSGWSGPLIAVGGILGTVLGSKNIQTFSDLSILFAVIFLVSSLFNSTASKSKWFRSAGQHVAGGLALWSVVGQIWATWYLLGNLALTSLLIDASRLLLVTAVVLVVFNDAQSFVTSQEAPAGQPLNQPQKQSHNTHAKRLTTKLLPLTTNSSS
jgi:hypothetical protein